MFQAAICEDEPNIAKYIEKTLTQKFLENGITVAFDVFTNGNRFLEMLNEHYHYDMVFMDIEMPEADGITICKKLRNITHEPLVIFISNKDELVFSTFEVQPFRFIRKNLYDSLLPDLVSSILKELFQRQPKILQIIEPGSKDLFSYDINQLIYVEAQGMRCCIYTTDNTSVVKTKLYEIEKQLSNYDFLKPHRSYLINCQFISVIHKTEIELTNKTLIPIGRGRTDEVKKQYLNYTNGRIL